MTGSIACTFCCHVTPCSAVHLLSSACVISVLIQALFRSEENKQTHKIRGDAHFLDCVPKVPDKVWEALVQSQVTYNSVPENIPEEVSQKVWKALVQSQVRFNRVPEKVWEALVQSQSGEGSEEGSGEGLGGFVAKPGQVQQGSGERSGEGSGRVWCRARSGSTGFAEKVPGGFGAEPGQIQQGSGEGSGKGSGEGSGQVQQDSGEGSGEGLAGSTGFAAI